MPMISVRSTKKTECIDVTDRVQDVVRAQDLEHGYVIVFIPHTTAAVTINEGADHSVQHDILTKLNELVPSNGSYTHAEGNSDAHIKASILGASELILVENKKLQLGTWQHLFFFEGDGPRDRLMHVQLCAAPKNSIEKGI
jgi:secondary thiamine-phosphate synthase enzyme